MSPSETNLAKLILDDGCEINCLSVGYKHDCVGELVFNTSMTGYIETLTDPSFFGQIVVQTFPLVGNYGVSLGDMQSNRVWLNGFITNQIYDDSFNKNLNLVSWLNQNKVSTISRIDTRSLTKKIRDGLIKNGAIINSSNFNKNEILTKLKNFKIGKEAIEETSTKTIKKFTSNDFKPLTELSYNKLQIKKDYRICVIDFGTKTNIVRNLALRCREVFLMPFNSSLEEIQQLKPDGIVLSNGPGDPACNPFIVDKVKILIKLKIPILGICLGHQLLALAVGAKTKKLKFGHRGSNQPVLETKTKRCFITSQNHGYVVDFNSISDTVAKISFININDGTCEGLWFLQFPAISVQFHPEACAGPNDTNFIFDEFFKLIEFYKQR